MFLRSQSLGAQFGISFERLGSTRNSLVATAPPLPIPSRTQHTGRTWVEQICIGSKEKRSYAAKEMTEFQRIQASVQQTAAKISIDRGLLDWMTS
jgi:hypothetical protein